ncbi:polymorphic toxin-type HINT domain-containing protein [Nocardiopsis sp. JB363]|uniref:polymorphic toxin-type HINT domain-containing protein n=1 Tax=Nocardiopsis sp. JB363 TaxID=1434837 RepID=UPI00097AD20F|nr:polymorphic toxin-type HINT domain-containing protein [Nocardiopsis sp. JB363]SIO87637.1 YD repeat protein [Nocardiopsis sp. JB363]
MLRRLHDPDRGATMLEYAAVIVLVAAIAAALFISGIPGTISDGIGAAADRALSGEGEHEPGAGADPDGEGREPGDSGDSGADGSEPGGPGPGGPDADGADPQEPEGTTPQTPESEAPEDGGAEADDSTAPDGDSGADSAPGADAPGFLDPDSLRTGIENYRANPSTVDDVSLSPEDTSSDDPSDNPDEDSSGDQGQSADDTDQDSEPGADADNGDEDRPAFTWEDKGNYDWDCGWVAHYLCVVGGGLSQGAVEMGEGILDLGCHLHLCSHDGFKETWANTGAMAEGIWNDPWGSAKDIWNGFLEPFDENYDNLGGGDGTVKNLGYGATMLVGGFLKPFKLLGGKGPDGASGNDRGGSDRDGDSGDGDGQGGRRGDPDCDNSFLPGTLVVLADGGARPIEQVEVGDLVLAQDPESGERGAREVTALIPTGGGLPEQAEQRTLVEVSVDDGAGETGLVTATDDHPFWVPEQGWTDAIDLEPGTWLRTGNGTWTRVDTVDAYTVTGQAVHNLSVDDLRTYHVLAGDTPLLVHNCPPAGNDRGPTATERRNSPGTATGGQNLPQVTGTWLRGTEGNAGRTPRQIADQLEGRSFDTFDQFRGAYWNAVADTPELAGQFAPHQVTRMRNGNAPFAVQNQQVGGQRSYVLHHITPIGRGGGVYDLDNIMVVTPRYHRDILDPDYHYGGG